jgi:hypothetical protein
VCKNNPHDQHVFKHTTWPFETRISTPGISLSSPPLLVQRHVNSLLLSKFLRLQDRQGKLDKLTLDWWMLPRGSSRQQRFVAWCDCFKPEEHRDFNLGISALVICVDMLDEGFDLPELKIAAFHDIRKSLAVTLQLAGRFRVTEPTMTSPSLPKRARQSPRAMASSMTL